MSYIFISYSHKDKAYAHKLHQYLFEHDINAWIDDRLDYGSRWPREVEKRVRECAAFILIMSPNSHESDWVQGELNLARRLKKTIYTLLLDGENWWHLHTIQYIDVRNEGMPPARFIASLLKNVPEVKNEDKANVSIQIGGDVQGNIVVGNENTIQTLEEAKQIPKKKRSERKPNKQAVQKKPELKQTVPSYDFRKLGIGGMILVGIVAILFVGNYIFNNLPVNETPEISPSATLEPVTSTVTEIPFTPTVTLTPTPGIGSTLISEKDGMTLVFVPAGEFTMGSDDSNQSDERPEYQVFLDSYWIDQTEVTNAMYVKCVDANQCNLPSNTNTFNNSEYANHPVINVSWNDAKAYCEWADRRLPTEAEWEKAARGTDGRTYPWGNTDPKDNLLNFNGNVGDTTAVGSYPQGASIYGALDMSGNVWEWVSSIYQPYPYDANDGRESLTSSDVRVLRGGSWDDFNFDVRSAFRNWSDPSSIDLILGFRCSRSP